MSALIRPKTITVEGLSSGGGTSAVSETRKLAAIVVADVVLADCADKSRRNAIRAEILNRCTDSLAAYKVPAVIRFVERLDVTAAGKRARVAS